MFEPALPVAPPEHLLYEFEGIFSRVFGQHRVEDFLLADQPMSNIGRQAGHAPVLATPAVNVSKTLVVPPCLGHKTLEPLQTVLTKAHAFFGSDLGGWPNHIPIVEAQTFQ